MIEFSHNPFFLLLNKHSIFLSKFLLSVSLNESVFLIVSISLTSSESLSLYESVYIIDSESLSISITDSKTVSFSEIVIWYNRREE